MTCAWCGNEYTSGYFGYGLGAFCSQKCAMQAKAEHQGGSSSEAGTGGGLISWLIIAAVAIGLYLLPAILFIWLFKINAPQSALDTAYHSGFAWFGSGVFWAGAGWLVYMKFFRRR